MMSRIPGQRQDVIIIFFETWNKYINLKVRIAWQV